MSIDISTEKLTAAAIGAAFVAFLWANRELRQRRRLKQHRLEEEELAGRREALRIRREELIERYGSIEVVDFIVSGRLWQGMSSEQLFEAWGQPADIDQKVFKSKTSQVWKYDEIGKNRYSRKVFVENDLVVGWQEQ